MDDVSDEYIKAVDKLKCPKKTLPDLKQERRLYKRTKTPPRMRLATYPTFAELENWRQMHEHPTFNKNRIIKEEDVLQSLKFAQPKTKIATMPSPYLILKHQKIYKSKKHNELIKEAKIDANLSHMSKVSKYPHADYWPKAYDSTFKPSKFFPFPKLPDKELHYEAAGPPFDTRLLRRPLAPVWRNTESLARESSLSIILAEDGKYDMEQWRKCSLTTLFKDDPLDPKSFYNTHYPLLLKRVPRRFKNNNDDGGENIDTMYRPMSRTPDIDMRYFDVMSRISLSDEIMLPPYGENTSRILSGRTSNSPRSPCSPPDKKSNMNIQDPECTENEGKFVETEEESAETKMHPVRGKDCVGEQKGSIEQISIETCSNESFPSASEGMDIPGANGGTVTSSSKRH